MKLVIFFMLLTSFRAIAFDGSSQQRIDLNGKGLSLHRVINEIESKYKYTEERTSITIEGSVTDETGRPLSGVSIVEKGTINGVSSGEDGGYKINVTDENAVLVFSIVGYTVREVSVKDNNYSKVVLNLIENNLDEVVVVGYGTQKKVNLSGAVATIDAKLLDSRPLTNLGQGLQGLIPGLNITVNGGRPGSTSNFNIRGTTSINGGGPLILVDNVQMDPNLINPADVQSVTVLKDAASTAIYGVRGAYGVILITTKKGKKVLPHKWNITSTMRAYALQGFLKP